MKKWTNKNGIALILTISVMTALSIMGVSFLRLLMLDQRNMLFKTNTWANGGAMEAAIRAGFWEIKDGLSNNPAYFGSTIESADDNSPFYFKNVIRATNTMLNIYRYGPEVDNVLRDNLGLLFSPSINSNVNDMLDNGLKLYSSSWHIRTLSEVTKIKNIGPATYEKLLPYLTTQPQDNADFVMNVIDYGRFDDSVALGGNNRFRALARDFKPDTTRESVNGAWIKIISGTGKDQVRKIVGALADDSPVLVLESDWTTIPDATSCYRIHSYVCPLNFNGVKDNLIRANLQILSSYLPVGSIGIYDPPSATSTFMGKLYESRMTTPTLFTDEADFRSRYLNSVITNPALQNEFLRLFDPKQPKGIWNSGTSKWNIYPVPIPWTFEHAGLFDMEIDAGMKRINKQTQPPQLQKRYVTVRVSGKREQATREEFEAGAFQNWVSTSDWVPVRSMADMANWAPVTNATFQNYDTATVAANVIPDAIKTGLWFDFGALQDGRGSDAVYDQIIETLAQAEDLYHSRFFTVTSGVVTPNLGSGRLEIKGVNTPNSTVLLGPSTGTVQQLAQYNFGDVACMVSMHDTGGDVFHSDVSGDYDLTINPPLATSVAEHHNLHHLNNAMYPPLLHYTPTFMMCQDATNSIDFRTEKQHTSTAFANCQSSINPNPHSLHEDMPLNCWIWGSGFSVSISSPNDFSNRYIDQTTAGYAADVRFCSAVATQGTTNLVQLLGIDKSLQNGAVILSDKLTLGDNGTTPLSNFNSTTPPATKELKGRIGFKREFDTTKYYFKKSPGGASDYYLGEFAVDYLRIIAGKRAGTPDRHPYFQSQTLTASNASTYKTMRVHYRVGLKQDPTLYTATDQNIVFTIQAELDMNPDVVPPSDFASDIVAPTQQSVTVNSLNDMKGFVELEIQSSPTVFLAVGTNPLNRNFAYRITIKNDGTTAAQMTAFLQSTIAITKVEIFYATPEETVSSSDHL